MSQEEFQEYFDVHEEFVKECFEQELINGSWDINHFTDIDNIFEAEIDCISSTCDVDIQIPEAEEASSSINSYPCDLCSQRFNRKSHLGQHKLTHEAGRPFGCALCGVHYRRKSDLTNHLKKHITPSVLNSNLDGQNVSVTNVINNKLMFMDPIHRKSVTPCDDSENKADEYQPNTKNYDRGKGHGRKRGRPKKDCLVTIDWNSELNSKPHTCNPCEISFEQEKALLNHARLHHIDEDVNIVTTHKKNSNSSEITILSNTNSDDVTNYSCDSCGAVFNRFDFLKRHKRQHMKNEFDETDERRMWCLYCGMFFKCIQELEAHTKQHFIPEKSKRLVCGETLDSRHELSDHVSQIHSDSLPTNSSKLRGKLCKDNKALKNHSMDHDTSDNGCIICGKRFKTKSRLKRHMISHQKNEVICNVCGKELADKKTLYKHKAIHSNSGNSGHSWFEKLFPCSSCEKVFRSRSSQQIHIRTHTGERPFGCRYCDKAFTDGGTLRKHERIHTGEKPYACPICQKAFNQRVVLREHIRNHHTETEAKDEQLTFYECKLCKNLFTSSMELCSHLIHHSDENAKHTREVAVQPRKYKRRSKLGNKKDTWCLVENIMSEQSDTENCKDEPMPSTAEMQAVQSIMHPDDIPFNHDMPVPVVRLPKSPVKSYKISNGNLMKNVQKSSIQMAYDKFSVSKSVFTQRNPTFVLKQGECARTSPTVFYYDSIPNPTVVDSFGTEFKENNNPEESKDRVFVEDMDLTNLNTEPNIEQPEFAVQDYNDLCNFDCYYQGGLEYYLHNYKNGEYFEDCELTLEPVNDCKIETELTFDMDYIKEVGANIEVSTEEMAPVLKEIISCDICDDIFEDIKELMKHIQTMHIG